MQQKKLHRMKRSLQVQKPRQINIDKIGNTQPMRVLKQTGQASPTDLKLHEKLPKCTLENHES